MEQDALSRVEEGVTIRADGAVKIEVKQAAATPNSGLNVVVVRSMMMPQTGSSVRSRPSNEMDQ